MAGVFAVIYVNLHAPWSSVALATDVCGRRYGTPPPLKCPSPTRHPSGNCPIDGDSADSTLRVAPTCQRSCKKDRVIQEPAMADMPTPQGIVLVIEPDKVEQIENIGPEECSGDGPLGTRREGSHVAPLCTARQGALLVEALILDQKSCCWALRARRIWGYD